MSFENQSKLDYNLDFSCMGNWIPKWRLPYLSGHGSRNRESIIWLHLCDVRFSKKKRNRSCQCWAHSGFIVFLVRPSDSFLSKRLTGSFKSKIVSLRHRTLGFFIKKVPIKLPTFLVLSLLFFLLFSSLTKDKILRGSAAIAALLRFSFPSPSGTVSNPLFQLWVPWQKFSFIECNSNYFIYCMNLCNLALQIQTWILPLKSKSISLFT